MLRVARSSLLAPAGRAARARALSAGGHRAGTEAVRFALSPVHAEHDAFQTWVSKKTRFVLDKRPSSVVPTYVPFWAFQGQLETESGPVSLEDDPLVSQVCASYRWRRSMTHVLKTDLSGAQPLTSDMLFRPPSWDVDIEVEPFGMFETMAWHHVRAAVVREYGAILREGSLRSRRVLLPAYVVEYSHLGLDFRVFISGDHGKAYGIEQERMDHKVPQRVVEELLHMVGFAWRRNARTAGYLGLGALLQFYAGAARFFATKLPLTAALAAAGFVGRRSAVAYRQWRSKRDWERERKQEMAAQQHMSDDWVFQSYSGRSSSSDSGERERRRRAEDRRRERDDRRQRAKQHERDRAEQAQQQRRARRDAAGQRFDSSDPYVVLGFAKGERPSLAEIKAHYRREIIKWHPDHNPTDRERATERAKVINAAYTELRRRVKAR